MTRQQKILAGCLVVLALAIGYAVFETPRQQVAPRETTVRPQSRAKAPEILAQVRQAENRLQIELLEPPPREFSGVERDLFGTIFPPPPPPPPPPPAPPMPKLPPPPLPEPVVAPPPATFVPTVRFSVLGYLEVEGRRIVFLESEGETFLARAGESFGDDFRVVELTPQRLVIEQAGVSRPIVLPLQDEQGGISTFEGSADPAAGGGMPRSRPSRTPGRLF